MMDLGKTLRSLFKSGPKQEPAAGWAIWIQAHTDLTRRIVYVHVADKAKAEEIALEAFVGLVTDREAVSESILADLGVAPGGHKVQTGNGWSYSMQGPPGGNNPLIFVYLSDESEADAVLRTINPGTIILKSEVPRIVLVRDLGIKPGGTRTI